MTANQPVCREAVEQVLGDIRALAEQVGTMDTRALRTAEPARQMFRPVMCAASLRQFLRGYRTQILVPIELPSVERAFHHAARNQVSELIELDQRVGREPLLEPFAAASRQVGRTQIKRLRPLRDQRVLQRYLAAVQTGAAQGWHTVVYGLVLSVYSIPLRPGLVTFAEQTTRGFVESAARRLCLANTECEELIASFCSELPGVVDRVLSQGSCPDQMLSIC